MFLEKILLKNFRNLERVFLELNPGINIFLGDNGQGKTNLLEAIYLLSTGDSHRTNRHRELINWDSQQALVQLKLNREDHSLKLSLQLGKKKVPRINDTPLDKVSELLGHLNVVLFSPEDLQLVKGSPSHRRKFLNVEISQVNSYYHHQLGQYNHVLKQRNNLLKDLRDKGQFHDDSGMLDIWDEQLIELGSNIIKKRLEVIEKLAILARLSQRKITGGGEELTLNYKYSFDRQPEKKGEIGVIFKQELVNNRKREISRGYTVSGPHRDDLILKINDIDVRRFGSQGQQRTAALALKLAELEFMKSETGEYPVLLLDDVFSELDQNRRQALVQVIKEKIQTLLTTTESGDLRLISDDHQQYFTVNRGRIQKRKRR